MFDKALLLVTVYAVCVAISVAGSILLIELLFYKKPGVKIDCVTASFNPDILTLSKEVCRK